MALPYHLDLQTRLQGAGTRLRLDVFLTGAASSTAQNPAHASIARSTTRDAYTTPDTPLVSLNRSNRSNQSLARLPSTLGPRLQMLDPNYVCVNIQEGRPNLDTVMTMHDADQRPLTVVVCGPATMSDHARRAALAMSRTRKVHFFEECFDW